jgi:hypothetical protein
LKDTMPGHLLLGDDAHNMPTARPYTWFDANSESALLAHEPKNHLVSYILNVFVWINLLLITFILCEFQRVLHKCEQGLHVALTPLYATYNVTNNSNTRDIVNNAFNYLEWTHVESKQSIACKTLCIQDTGILTFPCILKH